MDKDEEYWQGLQTTNLKIEAKLFNMGKPLRNSFKRSLVLDLRSV